MFVALRFVVLKRRASFLLVSCSSSSLEIDEVLYLDITTKCGHGGFSIIVKKGTEFLGGFSTRKRIGGQHGWLEVDILNSV